MTNDRRPALSRRALLGSFAALPLARPASATADELSVPLRAIAPGLHVFQGAYAVFTPANKGATANAAVLIGTDAAAVIDTGGSFQFGTALRRAIEGVTDKPIRYVVNTHMHPDHVFGNAAFLDDATDFVGHHKLPRALAARAERYLAANRLLLGEAAFEGTRIVPPTITVQDALTLDLGGRPLRLEAHPTAHTDNDLTVTDLATGTLVLGDLLFVRHTPALDGSIKGWLGVMAELARRPAPFAVPGHGPAAVPWPAALDPQRRYLQRIADEIRALIRQGRGMAEAAATVGLAEKDAWELFDEYNARNVSAAFAELEWE